MLLITLNVIFPIQRIRLPSYHSTCYRNSQRHCVSWENVKLQSLSLRSTIINQSSYSRQYTCVNAGGRGIGRRGRGRLGVRAASWVVIGHRATDVGVADVEAGAALRIVGYLSQYHEQGIAVVFLLADHSDAALLERHILGFLRDLHVGAGLLLDLLDVVAGLADYHAGRAVRD